ncbi:hypothetical protein KJ966_18350 [bacterium]|nr:hypothetical protein [bacterium]
MKGERFFFVLILVLLLVAGFGCSEEDESGSVTTSSSFVPDTTDTTGTTDTTPDTPSPFSAQAVTFNYIDRDMDAGELWGDITIAKATDETAVTQYRLYWGESTTTKLAGQNMISSLTADGTDKSHSFAQNSTIPAGATHLLVYTAYVDATNDIESTSPTALDIPDGVIELVKEINPSGSSNPGFFSKLGDLLFFYATNSSGETDPYKSDGTETGTIKIETGGNPPGGETAVMGGYLYFPSSDGVTFYREIFKSDGTTTSRVTGIYSSGNSNPEFLTVMGTNLYFKATDSPSNTKVWGTDGSSVFSASNYKSNLTSIAAVNSTLFYSGVGASGDSLWKSDGTAVTESEVISSFYSGSLNNFTAFNSKLFFTAAETSNSNNIELWVSDGSAVNTTELTVNASTTAYSKNLKEFNGWLYFTARSDTSASDGELWRTDGTTTTQVKKLCTACWADPDNLSVVGSNLYFSAQDDSNGKELWVTNGTTTTMVKDINSGGGSSPENLTAVGNNVFFAAEDGINGRELWFSDGSAEGTFLLHDFNLGSNGMEAGDLLLVGENLFIGARGDSANEELWRYYVK